MILNSKYGFLKGFGSAIALCAIVYLITKNKNDRNENQYVVLKSDYKIEGAGFLQKGTILRTDEGMSEGFTRFILYLNLKGGNYEKYPGGKDEIIPYWLNEAVTK